MFSTNPDGCGGAEVLVSVTLGRVEANDFC